MTGKVESMANKRHVYFFIRGEDGELYFGHRREAVNRNNHSRYCYIGNNVTFEPGEPDREGGNKIAHHVLFENVSKQRRFGSDW